MKTIKITKTVTEQITVNFPLYTTDGLHYYCFNDNACIAIKNSKIVGFAIEQFIEGNYPYSWLSLTQITEQEFKTVWQQAQSEITLEYHRIFSKQNDFIEAQAERSNEQ